MRGPVYFPGVLAEVNCVLIAAVGAGSFRVGPRQLVLDKVYGGHMRTVHTLHPVRTSAESQALLPPSSRLAANLLMDVPRTCTLCTLNMPIVQIMDSSPYAEKTQFPSQSSGPARGRVRDQNRQLNLIGLAVASRKHIDIMKCFDLHNGLLSSVWASVLAAELYS